MGLAQILERRDASAPLVRRIAAGLHEGDRTGGLIRGDQAQERIFVPLAGLPGDAEYVAAHRKNNKLVRMKRVGGVEVPTVVVNRGELEEAAPTVQLLFIEAALVQLGLVADGLLAGKFSVAEEDAQANEVWRQELLPRFWELRRQTEAFRREVDPTFALIDVPFAEVDPKAANFAELTDDLLLCFARIIAEIRDELSK